MSPELPAGLHLVDNSVWQRHQHPAVAPLIAEASAGDRLCSAGPLVAEALYSARGETELVALREELTRGLRYLESNEDTWRLAFDAMATMAAHAPQYHRRPMVHYLIAAVAQQHGVWVLHYDGDFEKLQQHSGLAFRQRWVAPRGSL